MEPLNDQVVVDANGTKAKAESSLFDSVRKRMQRIHRGNGSDDGRQFWMPDSRAKQCYDCNTSFNTLRRRHHCRICGQVFCHRCSQQTIDTKLYKSILGSTETNGPVRVCRYCYRVATRNDQSADNNLSERRIGAQEIKTNPTSSTAGNGINSWFMSSTIGRKLSSSASIVSIGDMVRSTIVNSERKPSITRPVSAASDEHSRRYSVTPLANYESATGNYDLVSSTSFDNLRSLISKVGDDESKPNWVKEILEETKQRQLEEQQQKQRQHIEFAEQYRSNDYYSSDEDFNELNTQDNTQFGESDSSNIKLKFNSGESIVRYSLSPSFGSDERSKKRSAKSSPLNTGNANFLESCDSNDASYDLLRQMMPDENSYIDSIISTKFDKENTKPEDTSTSISDSDKKLPVNEELVFPLMELIYDQHCSRILQQTLIDEKLSLDWQPIMNELSKRIATTVTLSLHPHLSSVDSFYTDSTNVKQGLRRNTVASIKCDNTYYPMDIRQRVKVKTIPSGSKTDCRIVNGVVFTKNVAHRKMRTRIDNARVLLFASSIGYDERKRSLATTTSTSAILKLTSIDSMRLQEPSYITNLIAKIVALKPDVIFVQGSVSHSAMELLHSMNITVVLNVKKSVLERIALFTAAQLIYTPEIISELKIGQCGMFYLQEYVISKELDATGNRNGVPIKKTLMFVEACATTPGVGCSVILRGSNRFVEFRQLKFILGYMIYLHYNSRLEKAFHLALNCLPIENGTWQSMSELYQHLSRTRQRIDSARSVYSRSTEGRVAQLNDTVNGQFKGDESKLSKSQLTTICDNSDPLRSALDENENEESLSSSNKLDNVQLTQIISRTFEQLLTSLSLSSSPGIEFPMPYLMESSIHNKSSLRHYFPPNLIISERLSQFTSQEIDQMGSFSNKQFQRAEHLEKDDDYANYIFLNSHYAEIRQEHPELIDALNKKAESKLTPLGRLLSLRYMVSKPHPMLTNSEYDLRNNSKQFIADFRACGPYLRCIPDIGDQRQDLKNGLRNGNKDNGNDEVPSDNLPIEPLSCIDQENISVLYSVFSPQSKNAPNYCCKPRILDIAYYGRNDMSIGSFLFRHFFFRSTRFNLSTQQNNAEGDPFLSPNSPTSSRKIFCSSETCNASMFRHLMRFAHHRGTITVLLNKIHDSKNVTMPHTVLTWTFCVSCRQKSPNVEMTSDALAFSFGKFLELKFYGNRHFNYQKYFPELSSEAANTKCCAHSLYKESYQFFSYDQLVVSFKYDPIVLYEVVLPSPIISVTRNQFSRTDLINYLQDLTVRGHEVYARISEEVSKLKESIVNKTNAPLVGGLILEPNDIALMDEWNQQLEREEAEFVQFIKEAHITISSPELETLSVVDLFRMQNKAIRIKKSIVEVVASWNKRFNEFFTARRRNPDKLITSLMNRILPDVSKENKNQDTLSNKSIDLDKNCDVVSMEFTLNSEPVPPSPNPDSKIDSELTSSINSLTNNEANVKVPASMLTTITSKVISKVATKVDQLASTENVEGLSNSSFTARFLTRANEEIGINIVNPFETGSVTRIYQMFEHFHLPTYKEMSIIVRDKDLGSIIAYALTTPEYERKLADKSLQSKKVSNSSTAELVDGSVNSTTKAETSDAGTAKTLASDANQHIDVQYNDSFAKFYCCIYFAEQFRRLRSKLLVDGDRSNRDTVRRLLPLNTVSDPFAEELYIHSLANSIPWNAIGGKSGSTFSKTQNQRFILKEISKGELNHFLTFVCDYIAYCERVLLEKNPSAFVKIVGVYQISYKNTCTNKASIHHILVMENLFYECNISFIYDLKGSMRNRKAEIIPNVAQEGEPQMGDNETNQANNSDDNLRNVHDEAKLYQSNHTQTTSVLMDENLRNMCTLYPLYVHEHSKKLLMEAIYRDSEFLRSHAVMDYSLLVGFDEQYAEYVVGIIDYVRLFNWEKELEFRVKKLGKTIDPTIVHPQQYQKRFLEAINEYFVEVPDKWHPFLQLVPLSGSHLPGHMDEDTVADKINSASKLNSETASIFSNFESNNDSTL